MRIRRLIAVLIVTIAIACGIAGYVIYHFYEQSPLEEAEFEPYRSALHILFVDASNDTLGSLVAEYKLVESKPYIIDLNFTLTFTSEMKDGEPVVSNLTVTYGAWECFLEYGPSPLIPPSRPRNVSLHSGESFVDCWSGNISRFQRPSIAAVAKIYSLLLHFSDGRDILIKNRDLSTSDLINTYTRLSKLSGVVGSKTLIFRV